MRIIVKAYPLVDSALVFSAMAEQEWAVYLDSGRIDGQAPRVESERYDVLAIRPSLTLISNDEQTIISAEGVSRSSKNDPLEILQTELEAQFVHLETDAETEHLAYLPGAYGFFSYDLARRFESLPSTASDLEQLPQMVVGLYSAIVLADNLEKNLTIIAVDNDDGQALVGVWSAHIENLIERNSQVKQNRQISPKAINNTLKAQSLSENLSVSQYNKQFAKIRQYTIEGDCYQVNFAKRFSAKVIGNEWQTYQKLRVDSPAPFGAFLKYSFATVLSNSPESFIRCRERQVTTSPIKGTRPRDHRNPERDQRIAGELLSSAKDRAENLMIVDLMRNDLSKSCELGSVQVPKLFALHSFANVHHLISTVTGVLKKGHSALDLLRSCFPGGSITGAPKIRAMEIIEELEPDRRGLYCGSIGYVGMDGNLETSITIRTMVVKDSIARFSAGGGLVIDSDPESEHQELLDKAKMMKQAIEITEL